MMANPQTLLNIIQGATALIRLMEASGADASLLVSAIKKARAEGRDLTDSELKEFHDNCQSAIDKARAEVNNDSGGSR